jgi:hypothetical protein
VHCGYSLGKVERITKKQYSFCFRENEFADDPAIRGEVMASLINAFLTNLGGMDVDEYIAANSIVQNMKNKIQ